MGRPAVVAAGARRQGRGQIWPCCGCCLLLVSLLRPGQDPRAAKGGSAMGCCGRAVLLPRAQPGRSRGLVGARPTEKMERGRSIGGLMLDGCWRQVHGGGGNNQRVWEEDGALVAGPRKARPWRERRREGVRLCVGEGEIN